MKRIYLCIDLKTFYASVECVERGLDPFKTDLVVADASRGKGTICLAISPKMKERGIKNRCRFYEIPEGINPVVAKPRMKKYIEYSAWIYSIYLKYVSKDDIHVYSIDECFLDITTYLKLYKKEPIDIAKMIIDDVYKTTGITATAGIGTNLYLTKIALDITAKHVDSHIGYLDEEKYKEELWHHKPLTDFWQIGRGISKRLERLGIHDMYDIAHADSKILYKEFGVNAELLIDHANGIEPCTISDIKNYKSQGHSLSNTQVLFHDYDKDSAKKVLTEMIDSLVLELVAKKKKTNHIWFYIGYSNDKDKPVSESRKLSNPTSSFNKILSFIISDYDHHVKTNSMIRRIGVSFSISSSTNVQEDLFSNKTIEEDDTKLEETVLNIKKKYGNNSILRAVSYTENATARERNKLIGGHNAE
jgi:DNA polymerase V